MKCCKKAYRESNSYCGLFRCPCLEESCRFYGEMTKADRIRVMSDEELGNFLVSVESRRSCGGGGAIWKDAAHAIQWLKKRVEE